MPPPPPPPPPPGGFKPAKSGAASSGAKPAFLDDICKGTALRKVPDADKNDRSEVKAVVKSSDNASSGGPAPTGLAARMNPGLNNLFKEMNTRNLKPVGAKTDAPAPIPKPDSNQQKSFEENSLSSGSGVSQAVRQNLPMPPSSNVRPPTSALPPPPNGGQTYRPPPPPVAAQPPPPPPPPLATPNLQFSHPRPPPTPPSVPNADFDLEARFGKLFLADSALPPPPAPYTGPKTFISQLHSKKPRAPQVPSY